jgi:hypothetical protein
MLGRYASRIPAMQGFVKQHRLPYTFVGQDFIPKPQHPFIVWLEGGMTQEVMIDH